jgi:hypothetical protein
MVWGKAEEECGVRLGILDGVRRGLKVRELRTWDYVGR